MPRIPGVPDVGEYEQLHNLSDIAYCEDFMQLIDPLRDAAFRFCLDGNTAAASHLNLWANELAWKANHDRWRREDMIRWLYLDSLLRTEGKTYPDVYERFAWATGTEQLLEEIADG